MFSVKIYYFVLTALTMIFLYRVSSQLSLLIINSVFIVMFFEPKTEQIELLKLKERMNE